MKNSINSVPQFSMARQHFSWHTFILRPTSLMVTTIIIRENRIERRRNNLFDSLTLILDRWTKTGEEYKTIKVLNQLQRTISKEYLIQGRDG